jgi:hypothetical protein
MRPIRPVLVALVLGGLVAAGCGAQGQPATPATTPTDPTTPPASAPTTTSPGPGATAKQPARTASTVLGDRISDPQVAADRLLQAWMRGDRAAAGRLASQAVVDRLFSEPPPAQSPETLPCRLADAATFVCSYPLAQRAELTMIVEGGASAGYGVSGVELGD